MSSIGTGRGTPIVHPVAGQVVDPHPLATMAAREMPAPRPAGAEVTPWLIGWLEDRGAPVEVADAIRARDALGRQRYGQPLMTGDGRDGVADLAQELADALQYTAKARMLGQDLTPVRALLIELVALIDG